MTYRRLGSRVGALLGLVGLLLAIPPLAHARTLSFDERVAAQKAIEQVYWSHRIWPKENPGPKPPLPAVMPDEAIRAKVEDYLKKSNALEKWWRRPITADQLQAEMDRMAKNTRDGAMLQEIYRALGNDPFVVAETLARPTLVERLARNWYAADPRFHGELKAKAEAALAACKSPDCMKSMGGKYRETTSRLSVDRAGQAADEKGSAVLLQADEWTDHLGRLARKLGTRGASNLTGLVSGLEATSESFVVTAVLAQRDREITTASVVWPNRSFDAWWDAERVAVQSSIEQPPGTFRLPSASSTVCTNDTWSPTYSDLPVPGFYSAVWTGTEMIVWGGNGDSTGGRYNPATDTWTTTSTGANVPSGRSNHTAVWTGTEMIVWGGYYANTEFNTGGRYNPLTDTWTATSTAVNVPSGRDGHTAVWTGTEMIVWGGLDNTGGRYNPSNDTWIATSTGANVPSARYLHTAVWTGTEMIIWGGSVDSTGGRYNPSTDTWIATSTGPNVPDARSGHTAVWTGTEMIVWGGNSDITGEVNTGGRYDPAADAWIATSTGANAPSARVFHTAVWTGREMIVWGGSVDSTGGRYNPSKDTWISTSTGANVPAARSFHTAVWTGTEMIVWGGSYGNTGARYNPSTDSWVATSMGANVPSGRDGHTAVWTGTEMIVWGGDFFDTGGRYNPSTDSWMPTSTGTNVPEARLDHSAVWTGTEMIIWAGINDAGVLLNTGGRYAPSTDRWTATSTGTRVPGARYSVAIAAWTGTEMIVWGGIDTARMSTNTGGRYNPSSDSWTATSTGPNVPYASTRAAVWTGTELMVWDEPSKSVRGYDLSTDGWTVISTGANVPDVIVGPTVWTGTEIIFWGGYFGERYNPSTDTWAAISTGSGVPDGRIGFTSVWTGSEMIVWGGIAGGLVFDTGGRYNPSTDTWTPTSTGANAPSARYRHTAVWTGTEMIVWGGEEQYEAESTSTGGRYCACPNGRILYRDADGDGYGDPGVSIASCDGSIPAGYVVDKTDCNDANASVHPGAAEMCDGIDDNCDGAIDEGGAGLCNDGNVCTDDVCDGVAGCDHTNNSAPCDDGNLCTRGDTCQNGVCTPTFNGLNRPRPRPSNYYKELCENAGHGRDSHHDDEITDTDALCVAALAPAFSTLGTAVDVCAVIDEDGSRGHRHHDDHGSNTPECVEAADELIATALNICRARVCDAQNVDSRCGTSGHHVIETTVGVSFGDANSILDDPNRTKAMCEKADCELKEINDGRALEMNP